MATTPPKLSLVFMRTLCPALLGSSLCGVLLCTMWFRRGFSERYFPKAGLQVAALLLSDSTTLDDYSEFMGLAFLSVNKELRPSQQP